MRRRSDRFLKALSTSASALVVTHNNPDPDAIATGWAAASLIRIRLEKEAHLVAGGAITRAENLRMVQTLSPPLELVEDLTVGPEVAVVFVDCSPTADNHLLSETKTQPAAVIDHHIQTGLRFRTQFRDIRPKLVACSTIASQYLREQGIEPSREMATGLLYGIISDAASSPVLTRPDRGAFSWLAHRADYNLLAAIQTAPLPRSHYRDLRSALNGAVVFQDSVFCFLTRVEGPETVGELADLMIRCEGMERALCAGVVGSDVLVSVRSTPNGTDASQIVRKCLRGFGQGGGHQNRAGGRIPCQGKSSQARKELGETLRSRWLQACNLPDDGGSLLVGMTPRTDRES